MRIPQYLVPEPLPRPFLLSNNPSSYFALLFTALVRLLSTSPSAAVGVRAAEVRFLFRVPSSVSVSRSSFTPTSLLVWDWTDYEGFVPQHSSVSRVCFDCTFDRRLCTTKQYFVVVSTVPSVTVTTCNSRSHSCFTGGQRSERSISSLRAFSGVVKTALSVQQSHVALSHSASQ